MNKSPLEQVGEIEELVRQLYIIENKMNSGHFIGAWRELRRIIAYLENSKQRIIVENTQNAK